MVRARKHPVKKLAAYTPDEKPRAICPECWSRPSVSGRDREASRDRSKGWTTTYNREVVQGVPLSVYTTQYPCSHPGCSVIIIVKSVFSQAPVPLPWVEKGQLRGEDAVRYRAGTTLADRWIADTPEIQLPAEEAPAEVPRRTRQRKDATAKPTPKAARGAATPVPKPKSRGRKKPASPPVEAPVDAPARRHPEDKKPRKPRSDKGKKRGPYKRRST